VLNHRWLVTASGTAGPDRWQIGAMTLLLALASAPLLLTLRPQIGLFIVVLFVLRLAALRWSTLPTGTWVLVGLTLLGGLNVLDAYHGLAGKQPGTALLLTMIALKLLEVRQPRDLRVLSTVFGFLLVVQFLFDTSGWMAAYLAVLLLGNLALMVDLGAESGRARLRSALGTAGSLMIQALPLAVLLFVLFPRLDAPLWDLGLDDNVARTGLKNWLEPGSIGELVISGEDAFRARFDEPPPIGADAMYWRGPVLWRTNGQRWMPDAALEVPAEGPVVEPLAAPVAYTVVIEPTDQHWLLALDMPLVIPSDAILTADLQVRSKRPVDDLRLYRMTSALRYRTLGLSSYEETLALQLPDNITPRMRQLVAGWTADGAPAGSVVQRALDHFNREPFRYTLLPPPLGDNVADSFLFETKSGFCEHYASSFVLLMRIAGIPARIVAGYLGGEYNPISKDYLVRQSDAHAWSEVWLPDKGWVRVDPTAAVAAERVERNGRVAAMGAGAPVRFRIDGESGLAQLIRGARLFADALDAGWTNWVIGFSSSTQRHMLDRLGLGHWREYGLAVLMAAGALAIMLAWSLMLTPKGRAADPVVREWDRFSSRLGRIGLPRGSREGPMDYRDRILAARPDLARDIEPIVACYLNIRYRANGDTAQLAELRRRIAQFHPRRGGRALAAWTGR